MSDLNNFLDQFKETSKNKKSEAKISEGQKVVHKVRVGDLHENPEQARASFSTDELQTLANSIDREGLHHPIHIWRCQRDNNLYIASGHRRSAACEFLRGPNYLIDAFVFNTESEAQEAAVSINEFAKQIHPLERANEIETLQKVGRFKSIEDIEKYYGWSKGNAYKYQKLTSIPRDLRGKLIDAGHNSLKKCLAVSQEIEEVIKDIKKEKGMISENHIADVIEEYIPHLLESQNKNEKRSKKGKINTKGILLLENGIGKFRENVFRKLDDDEFAELEQIYELLGKRIRERKN